MWGGGFISFKKVNYVGGEDPGVAQGLKRGLLGNLISTSKMDPRKPVLGAKMECRFRSKERKQSPGTTSCEGTVKKKTRAKKSEETHRDQGVCGRGIGRLKLLRKKDPGGN